MKKRIAALALATLGAAALAGPAAASHGGLHPTFRTEKTYFHCTSANKVGNVSLVTDGPTSWNTTAPTTSYTMGGGCGAVDSGVKGGNQATLYDAVFSGTFTGNLRDMTFSLHNLVLSQARQGTVHPINVWISVDGENVTPPTGKAVNTTPVKSSTGASELFEFSLTNFGFANDVLDDAGNLIDVETGGLALQDGDGDMEHSFAIAIDSGAPNRQNAWVWDATEIASGITFNPATLAATKITVNLPTAGEGE